jgi:hypothetical protein
MKTFPYFKALFDSYLHIYTTPCNNIIRDMINGFIFKLIIPYYCNLLKL